MQSSQTLPIIVKRKNLATPYPIPVFNVSNEISVTSKVLCDLLENQGYATSADSIQDAYLAKGAQLDLH